MSIALSEFWTRLVRSGITDAAGCKRLASAYSRAHKGTPPSDSAALARFMIKAGKLTKFQARALLADQPRDIRIASFVIRSDRSAPPFSRWVGAARIDDGRCGLLFRAGTDQLSGGKSQWFQTHQDITIAGVQAFESESFARAMLVFSPLPDGRPLHDVLDQRGSLPPREACEIGISLATALDSLHARPLIHGAVRLDRVWIPDNGDPILLRDPSGPPLAPDDDDSSAWLEKVDLPELYAAPEFAVAGQACDPSTDIYSLGCLLFRLVSGRPPYSGGSFRETMAAHASQTPTELSEAVAKGESGDPLLRVLAYALAKNPNSRFATARQLSDALRATLRLLPSDQKVTAPQKARAAAPPTSLSTHVEKPSVGKQPTVPKQPAVAKAKPTSAPSPVPQRGDAETSAGPAEPISAVTEPATKSESKPSSPAAPPLEPPPVKQDESKTPALETSPQEPSRPAPTQQPAVADTPAPLPQRPTPPELPATPTSLPDTQQEPPPPSRPLRRRKKKNQKAPLVLGSLCVVVLMLVIALAVHDPSAPVAGKKPRPPIPDVIPSVSNRQSTRPVEATRADPTASAKVGGYQLVSDDRLLFVPPHAADTPDAPLELLPPGPAVIVSTRLAEVRRSPIGSALIEALSPELDGLLQSVAQRTKVPVDLISRCTAAMHPGQAGWPEVSLAIELSQPQVASDLVEKWQVAASRTPQGVTIYAGDSVDGDAYYFPKGQTISRFAVGSIERIGEVADAEGAAIPLPPTSQGLWKASSDQSDLVVLITPNFLFADGRALLESSAPELIAPLKDVLQPDVASALILADFDELGFAELRLVPSGGLSEPALLNAVRQSIQTWPSWADQFIVDSVPDPSWRLLASRLPSMMRFVVDQSRFGISDGAAVANTYLPPQAVPQVTLATLLAMNTPPGSATGGAGAAQPSRTLTVEEMLARKMSVSFGQESLEDAVTAIVDAFEQLLPTGSTMPEVRIIGGDLQLMGITQNQQVRDFSKSDLPLRQVLTDLVVGANPDKTATSPKDPKQALIWVVADDPQAPQKSVILITTRQAAENKYELPAEFR